MTLLGINIYEDEKLGKVYIWYYAFENEICEVNYSNIVDCKCDKGIISVLGSNVDVGMTNLIPSTGVS